MKKVLLFLFLLISVQCFSQLSPTRVVRITNSTTNFSTPLSNDNILIDNGTKKMYLTLLPILGTNSLSTLTEDVDYRDLTTDEIQSLTISNDTLFLSLSNDTIKLPIETDPITGAVNGIVKADGAGNISAAVNGTDYNSQTLQQVTAKGNTTDDTIQVHVLQATGAGNSYFTGPLGIGTTGPATQLEIKAPSAGASPTLRISNDGTATGDMTLELRRNDGDAAIIKIVPGATGLKIGSTHINGDIRFYTQSNMALTSNERMVIDDTGNVGIGTTSPTSRLMVKGSGATSATSALNVTNSADTSALFVRDDGNIGIGTTVPGAYKLNVVGSGLFNLDNTSAVPTDNLTTDEALNVVNNNAAAVYSGIRLRTRVASVVQALIGLEHKGAIETGEIFFKIRNGGLSSAEILRLSPTLATVSGGLNISGNVGIGTTGPAGKLHVALDTTNVGTAWRAGVTNVAAITGADGVLEIVSNQGGNVGSAITLSEVDATPAFVNKWGIYRRTTAGGNDLRIGYGTNVDFWSNTDFLSIQSDGDVIINQGNVGIGLTTGLTAKVNIAAGTASVAPLLFKSGILLTTPLPGSVEFLDDAWYGTITTGAERKQFAFTSDITGTNSGTNTGDQNISTTGAAGNISISSGSTLNLNVDDADANSSNELNDSVKIENNYIKIYETGSSTPDSALISITESQISDLQAYLTSETDPIFTAWDKDYNDLTNVPSTFTPAAHTLDGHSNVTVTANSSGELLKWNGTAWINNTLAEAGIKAAFSENTGFNKNFGTTTGTVAQGNDSRIVNGQTAYGWGNHAGLYDNYDYWGIAADVGTLHFVTSQNPIDFAGAGGIQTTYSANQLTIDGSGIDLSTAGGWLDAGTYLRQETLTDEVRIGSATGMGAYILQVTGNSRFAGTLTSTSTMTATNFILSSDERLKRKIQYLNNLKWTDKVDFHSFYFKNDPEKRKRFGVIAQEIEDFAPELIYTGEDGLKSVSYIDLLIAKTARQDQQIQELQTELEGQKKLMINLLNRINKLEDEK